MDSCHGRVVRGRGDLVASGAGWSAPGWSALFEIVVGLGGDRNLAASRHVLAVLLIVAGLVLLGRRLLAARRL